MLKFEILETSEPMIGFHTVRSKIPGGWLVYITHSTSNEAGCCFVPDHRHEWDGSSLPTTEEVANGSGIRVSEA